MRAARLALAASGVAAMGFGAVLLLTTQRFEQLLSLAAWLAAAIVVHDGILAPSTTLVTRGMDAAGRMLGGRTRSLIRIAWATGACLTLLAVPLIVAQARGPRNDSVLAGDYGRDLVLLWATILAITVLAVAVDAWRARRTSARRPSTDP